MNKTRLTAEELNKSAVEVEKFFQIDLIKSFMIAFVIADHSFHASLRPYLGGELWIRMAIPVFLIIMGFNMGN